MKESLIQFLKFGIVGVSNTVINYLLNIGTLYLLRNFHWDWDYIVANIVSFVLSVLWSFFWNEKYVFVANKSYKCSKFVRLMKMYMCYGVTGIFLNNMISFIWVSVLGYSKLVAPLVNMPISVPVNYYLNKRWTFEE